MADPTHIVVRNAREHNLKGVDVEVPRHAMVVFTGVSGSGKSSLVHDTLYKEGQRRFMESLSAYARQFLGQMERPEVDAVEGISPTLSIDQKTVNRNPRSTVGTVTEIYDHLRLLMARLGKPHCPICATPIRRLGPEQLVDQVIERFEGQKIQVLAPVIQERKGEYRKEMEELARDGWVRARVDGEHVRLDDPPTLERYKKHTIEVVVDRLRLKVSDRGRLVEAVETALEMGGQVVTLLAEKEEQTFSTSRACPNHPEQAIPELEPRQFSFNSPQGACPTCEGLGELRQFEPDLVLDSSLPIQEAVKVFNKDGKIPFGALNRDGLAQIVDQLGADPTVPVNQWTSVQRRRLMYGDASLHYTALKERDGRLQRRTFLWRGLIPLLDRLYHFTKFPPFEAFRSRSTCPDCHGARLSPISRAVTFRGRGIHEFSQLPIGELYAFFSKVELEPAEHEVGELLVAEIQERLFFLVEVGLSYLSLSRGANTLSGGEAQRIRLASQVGSGLQGVTYILDEPSIGLHPRDNQRLLNAMRRLRDRGNTLLVVEHDAETMLAADYLIDVGPAAGRLGGVITAEGTPAEFLRSDCLTAQYLRGDKAIEVPARRREGDGTALMIRGARQNNLNGVDVRIPLRMMTVVTGVSGSGKSSLVFQVLEPAVTAHLQKAPRPTNLDRLEGLDEIEKIIRINQRPIGRTPRSNPATYSGVMTIIRELFAQTPEARARGYTKSRFSFNVKGGRCEECGGAGVKTVEMQFLPDVVVPCESCGGKRFNRETLDIRWKEHTISDVLALPIEQALELFSAIPKIKRILQTLVDVGLGYISLGQPSTTLSGGEAQRMKLASELHKPSKGRTLYLLDEPTTGLHVDDVAKLLVALNRLVDQGNTVLIVEHHTDIMRAADHLIDLGPEGGEGGGQIVGQGTPEYIATLDSPTGRALAREEGLSPSELPLAAEATTERYITRPDALVVEGARKHNLQGVSVQIPHGEMTVVTGVSGSGKSSLAFETIFAEGQRRYVESLSTYARRFLGRVQRAPVERLEGLQPAIAIDQTSASHNPRSTVATVTEIYDVLRLLYSRIGTPHCPHCGRVLRPESASLAARRLSEEVSEAGWIVTALPEETDPKERLSLLTRDGWQRLLLWDGEEAKEVAIDSEGAAAALQSGAYLVLDRLNPSRSERSRVSEAIAHGYNMGRGVVTFIGRKTHVEKRFTEGLECPEHGLILTELTPRHFSFNSRIGACERCEGLGTIRQVVPDRLFAGGGAPLDALHGKVAVSLKRSPRLLATFTALLESRGFTLEDPISSWPADFRRIVLDGSPEPLAVSWERKHGGTLRQNQAITLWPGLMSLMEKAKIGVKWVTQDVPCPSCHGARLGPVMRSVTLEGRSLHQFCGLTVDEARAEVSGWELTGERKVIAARARLELERRLSFLCDVGLGYLGLHRAAESLSGGESQRIRLASQLGSGLTGVTYVLDEPTIGLHPRDTDRLLGTLEGLRDLGNTLVVVEHDPDTIERADYVIDMGPAAGRYGGQVLSAGTPEDIRQDPHSLTGRWLSGEASIPSRGKRRGAVGSISLTKPRIHNLKLNRITLPMGAWTTVTGVSGSGKSSLIMDTLAPALRRELGLEGSPGPYGKLTVEGPLDGVVVVDQRPLSKSPRSTPATYIGVMDKLRALFARTLGSKERGWGPGRFSFNGAQGRCTQCEGRGAMLIEMHFLPDVWVTCDLCHGRRYNRETLEVRWKGKSIADVLAMRADEALEFFSAQRSIKRLLQALVDVGLGYVALGQPANTLSGGEAQRVKLAKELVSRKGRRIYILDEPTTGLHLADVAKLVQVLHALVEKGHTVVTIEHHLDMILQADKVLELGPDGGEAGGELIAQGTPEQIARKATATGEAIKKWRESRQTGS